MAGGKVEWSPNYVTQRRHDDIVARRSGDQPGAWRHGHLINTLLMRI